jgi:hypothetical protein
MNPEKPTATGAVLPLDLARELGINSLSNPPSEYSTRALRELLGGHLDKQIINATQAGVIMEVALHYDSTKHGVVHGDDRCEHISPGVRGAFLLVDAFQRLHDLRKRDAISETVVSAIVEVRPFFGANGLIAVTRTIELLDLARPLLPVLLNLPPDPVASKPAPPLDLYAFRLALDAAAQTLRNQPPTY